MLVATQPAVLTANVIRIADGLPYEAGTVYAFIGLSKPGDADDGKWWDGAAWTAAPGAWPTCTHVARGRWQYSVPAAALASKEGGSVVYSMLDAVDGAASTVVKTGGEHLIVPRVPGDVDTSAVASAVSTALAAAHGAGSWEWAPTGLHAITIALDDGLGHAVVGAAVAVYAGATIVAAGTSDPAGAVVVSLPNGAFEVRVFLGGWDIPTTPFNVTGDGLVAVTGTRLDIPASPDPASCRVAGYMRDSTGAVHDAVRVDFKAVVPAAGPSGQRTARVTSVLTGPAGDPVWLPGYFEVLLERGFTVAVDCKPAGVNDTRLVPDSPSTAFETWLPVA